MWSLNLVAHKLQKDYNLAKTPGLL
uniref:Uncharacterized protein n=1 Tax=Arundo donax TaxID=35708 RepID=A0A0A9EHB5_ARUDO